MLVDDEVLQSSYKVKFVSCKHHFCKKEGIIPPNINNWVGKNLKHSTVC